LLYWSESDADDVDHIFRMDLYADDPSAGKEELVIDPQWSTLRTSTAIASDTTKDPVETYCALYYENSIVKKTWGAGGVQTDVITVREHPGLISGPRNIALDLDNRMLYWTTGTPDSICRAPMDDTFPTQNAKIYVEVKYPSGLVIDPQNSQLYYFSYRGLTDRPTGIYAMDLVGNDSWNVAADDGARALVLVNGTITTKTTSTTSSTSPATSTSPPTTSSTSIIFSTSTVTATTSTTSRGDAEESNTAAIVASIVVGVLLLAGVVAGVMAARSSGRERNLVQPSATELARS